MGALRIVEHDPEKPVTGLDQVMDAGFRIRSCSIKDSTLRSDSIELDRCLVPDAGIVAGRRRVRRRARRLGSVARTSPRQRDIGVGERDHVWTMPRQRNRASDRIRRRQGIGIICVRRGRCWLRYEWRVRENARRGCCRRCLRRIGGWSRRSRRCGGRCLGKGGDLDIWRAGIAGAVAHPVAPAVIRCFGVGD